MSCSGYTNELGFKVYSNGVTTDHVGLCDHLMYCGKPHGMTFSSARTITIRRVKGGIFGNLTYMTPFEAMLAEFVEMHSGDFIGRDALTDKDRPTCRFGLTCESQIPLAGGAILDRDDQVGRITAGVPCPPLGLDLAYAVFDKPGPRVGRVLEMRLTGSSQHKCETVEQSIFDLDRSIVRGVDRTLPQRCKA